MFKGRKGKRLVPNTIHNNYRTIVLKAIKRKMKSEMKEKIFKETTNENEMRAIIVGNGESRMESFAS